MQHPDALLALVDWKGIQEDVGWLVSAKWKQVLISKRSENKKKTRADRRKGQGPQLMVN